MFIPIRTDYRMKRPPAVNYLLIAANVLLFLGGYHGGNERIYHWFLQPADLQLYQFFTAMFLHADWFHLLGNMLFLWVFGNAVNDRFGNLGYLLFYLAGGVMAGVGYLTLTGDIPSLGASGAIAAVVGAFLVLLPRTRVTILMVFYLITTFQVSSLLFVAIQVIYNLYYSAAALHSPGVGGVAWVAHSSGHIFGIVVAAGLMALRVLPRDPYDLLNLLHMWRRRKQYQRVVSGGYDPFSATGSAARSPAGSRTKRWVRTKSVDKTTSDTPDAKLMLLRREISEALARRDVPAAAVRYVELAGLDDDAVLPQSQQLDVANQLMSEQNYPAAARAYERFCGHYPTYQHLPDIFLMLGILYGRYLQQDARAEELLAKAAEGLTDPRKLDMARADLEAVRRRRTP